MPDFEQMVRRQQVLANFGEFALRNDDLDEILTEACRLVSEAMGTQRAKILEIQDGGQSLLMRSGIGWKPNTVGRVRLPMDERSSETFAIKEGKPVITRDIHKEDRFEIPGFMKEAGVIALANVPIFLPGGNAYGLLQVDDTAPHDFGEGDSEFLRTYATVLGPVIDRLHQIDIRHTAEERFRLIVETARDYAIFVTDADDRIIDWFPGAETVFGWTAPEAIGQTASILFTPEDRENHVDNQEIETARLHGVAPNVRWHLRKDGTRVFIDGSNRALRGVDGNLRGFFKIGQDVTERRRVEERLKESEIRQRALVEALPQLVWRSADDGEWTWAGPQWVAYTGLSAELSLGQGWLTALHPDDRQVAHAAWSAANQNGLFQADYRIRHAASDSYCWFKTRAVPMRGEGGRVIEWIGASTDIEDQVQARDVLARDREELETLVAARTKELMVAEEAMRQSQKMEAVGQLTGGVAHDFNNLLTIIRSSVDLLRRPNLPEDRRRRYIEAVSETVDRAAKLTGQLLAFARRSPLMPEVFNVGARLAAVADLLDTVTGARIRVVLDLPKIVCCVRADISQFETALVNMAVNARDAMDGEGTLTLRLRSAGSLPRIRGHGGSTVLFASVALSDTGSGIDPDKIDRIFEPFFTTKDIGKGTGLGLSQVFGFAKQSGGNIDVETDLGRGTTFTLFLPQVKTELPLVSDEEEYTETPLDGLDHRILVVEDNLEVGQFAMQILQDLGYKTTWAVNAEEALEQLGQDGAGFDVVFSDVVMPGMGGIGLARELQQRLPDMPIVLASGYSQVLAQEGGQGFEVLNKPYSIKQLSRILQRVVCK